VARFLFDRPIGFELGEHLDQLLDIQPGEVFHNRGELGHDRCDIPGDFACTEVASFASRTYDGDRFGLTQRFRDGLSQFGKCLQDELQHRSLVIFFPGVGLLGHGFCFGSPLESNDFGLGGSGRSDDIRLSDAFQPLSVGLPARFRFELESTGLRLSLDSIPFRIRLPLDGSLELFLAAQDFPFLHLNLLLLLDNGDLDFLALQRLVGLKALQVIGQIGLGLGFVCGGIVGGFLKQVVFLGFGTWRYRPPGELVRI
jgi:hypothetical protein